MKARSFLASRTTCGTRRKAREEKNVRHVFWEGERAPAARDPSWPRAPPVCRRSGKTGRDKITLHQAATGPLAVSNTTLISTAPSPLSLPSPPRRVCPRLRRYVGSRARSAMHCHTPLSAPPSPPSPPHARACQRFRRDAGSRPVEGSSRNTTRGLPVFINVLNCGGESGEENVGGVRKGPQGREQYRREVPHPPPSLAAPRTYEGDGHGQAALHAPAVLARPLVANTAVKEMDLVASLMYVRVCGRG